MKRKIKQKYHGLEITMMKLPKKPTRQPNHREKDHTMKTIEQRNT